MDCILCKKSFKGYGNNAEPLAKGMCCDLCNILVIKTRLTKFTNNYGPFVLPDGTLVLRQVLPSGNVEDSIVLGSRFAGGTSGGR